jgi:hypothetical protein
MGESNREGASWRRWTLIAGVAAVVSAASIGAMSLGSPQDPAPQQPDYFLFTDAEAVMLFFQVGEATVADFDFVMTTVKDVLTKSDKPERQSQANTFRVYRAPAAQNGIVTYTMLIDPVAKGLTYDFGKILSEGMPTEKVQEVFAKLTGALGGRPPSIAPMKKVVTQSGSH